MASGADHDVAIVGAGILGLAVARELLARKSALRVVVVDKEGAVGTHQTGHSSGVVHAGIYYEPGSLKARLCVDGAARLSAFCERSAIRFDRCGKLIVALEPSELGRLDRLEERGRANGVPGLRRLRAEEIAEVEPHATGIAALHSPHTAIVDFPAVAQALAAEVRERGGELRLGREVAAVRTTAGPRRGVVLEDPDGEPAAAARRAVFCAGAWADRLAVAAGAPADPRIVPFRGQYLRLRPGARRLVRGLVYPVPDPELPFLGVHLTRHVSGDVLLGPSALLVGARDAYRLGTVRPADVVSALTWPGTWRVARRWWRTGVEELRLATSRRAFVQACARYVPALGPGDVEPGWAGVRAQAVSREGRLVDDFVFSEAGGALHVRNAPSPAATSALAIGEVIADRAAEAFGL
jgi:L-2-hydroxyglutarate oxidase